MLLTLLNHSVCRTRVAHKTRKRPSSERVPRELNNTHLIYGMSLVGMLITWRLIQFPQKVTSFWPLIEGLDGVNDNWQMGKILTENWQSPRIYLTIDICLGCYWQLANDLIRSSLQTHKPLDSRTRTTTSTRLDLKFIRVFSNNGNPWKLHGTSFSPNKLVLLPRTPCHLLPLPQHSR